VTGLSPHSGAAPSSGRLRFFVILAGLHEKSPGTILFLKVALEQFAAIAEDLKSCFASA
jgi:hypothetical protein